MSFIKKIIFYILAVPITILTALICAAFLASWLVMVAGFTTLFFLVEFFDTGGKSK